MAIYLGNQKLNLSGIGSAWLGNTQVYSSVSYGDCLCFTGISSNGTITVQKTGSPIGTNMQYSFNKTSWVNVSFGTAISIPDGTTSIYFKGDNPNGLNSSASAYYRFSNSGFENIEASGNIMSLIDDGVCNTTIIPNSYCFANLFSMFGVMYASSLLLPATTLTSYCYYNMFYRSSVRNAPQLPAMTMASNCYNQMFYYCQDLQTAPPSLPATTLASACYKSMFTYCQYLRYVPLLPARTLQSDCYNSMFSYCSRLYVSNSSSSYAPTAWKIPSTGTCQQSSTLAMTNMFQNCLGTRSTDSPSFARRSQLTFYTQNTPV